MVRLSYIDKVSNKRKVAILYFDKVTIYLGKVTTHLGKIISLRMVAIPW